MVTKWAHGALLFLLGGVCGCVGPSMAGFPHASMHSAGGNEFTIAPHVGGGGATGGGFFDGGGLLSFAHDFGEIGLAVAAGAYAAGGGLNIHGHVELARRLSDPRNDFLFGLGYSDNNNMRVPQFGIGLLRGAPPLSHGGFGGFRFSAGPILSPGPEGAHMYLSGALGYRWLARRVFGFSFQVVPIIGVYAQPDPCIAGGGLVMFSFGFGGRETATAKPSGAKSESCVEQGPEGAVCR